VTASSASGPKIVGPLRIYTCCFTPENGSPVNAPAAFVPEKGRRIVRYHDARWSRPQIRVPGAASPSVQALPKTVPQVTAPAVRAAGSAAEAP